MMMLVEEDEDEETDKVERHHVPTRVVTTAFPKMPRHATSRENARESEHAKASRSKRRSTVRDSKNARLMRFCVEFTRTTSQTLL